MGRILRQAWWAPIAGVLALALFAFALVIGVTPGEDDETEDVVVGVLICLVGAATLVAGLWKRPQSRGVGSALIIVGCVLAAFWFWTLVLPLVAIVVAVGVLVSDARSRRGTAEAV